MPKSKRSRRTPTGHGADTVQQPGVLFVRFWVAQSLMREVAKTQANKEPAPARYPIDINLGVTVRVAEEENIGFTILTVQVKGDTRVKPYEVLVEIVGEFRPADGQSVNIGEFCREVGPTILFPYARQIVDRMTSDGRYGPIRLDPINVRGILGQHSWQDQPNPTASPIEPKPRA